MSHAQYTRSIRDGEGPSVRENRDNAVGWSPRGSKVSLNCQNSKAIGLVALVAGVAILAVALVLASGVVGGGKMGFISAGLVVGSMVAFGIAAYCLLGITPRKGAIEQRQEDFLLREKEAGRNASRTEDASDSEKVD